MALFAGDDRRDQSNRIKTDGVPYRFVATATPSPNDYIELLSYAGFLDVMDIGQAKTRFFKRNSEKADQLTLMSHKEKEFWLWVASWALFVTKPSDLDPAFSDDGYDLPPLDIRWHELPVDHLAGAGQERSGQQRMFRDATVDLSAAAREKRDSLPDRIAKLMELRADDPAAHRIIWHDLEAERHAIEKAVPSCATVYGNQDLDEREDLIGRFADGEVQELGAKPVMLGSGTNLQRHCAWSVFLGIGFKFNDFIQAVHRLRRFGQQAGSVRLDLIYTEAEREVRRSLERKWRQHNDMVQKMIDIVKEYGLSEIAMQQALVRALGVERVEASGPDYRIIHNDCVDETRRMEEGSVQLIVTSIPFSTQYEYSPNYADFGHTDDDPHFWRQMGFLIPELLRVLEPGRIAAVHVKDRIIPGGINGFGFQTLSTLHMDCVREFQRHGFAYLGMKTITTDVVRENNQTYRLGWSEQCKDGSRMGCGVPEYLLIFRRPPTDRSNGYADRPVKKDKKEWDPEARDWKHELGYSRARWQIDAHGYMRSNGNRPLLPGDLDGLDADQVYKVWKAHNLTQVYDFEHHVRIGEHLEMSGRLPPTFMLLPPHSLHPDAWTDVARMMTINAEQARKGQEMHLCLARGSLVLTRAGYKPIEMVAVGDEVLTHNGRWRRVQVVRNTGVQPVVDLRAHGVAALTLTPDHKVWSRQSDWVRRRDGAERTAPDWVRADQTVGGYVNLKLPPVEDCALTDQECWLLGRWLADGHIGARGEHVISVGRDKLEAFERMAGDAAGTRGEGTAVQIRLKGMSAAFKAAVAGCGTGAAEKQVPVSLLAAPAGKARALLDGYLSGDGHLVEDRGTWMATSISRALLLGMAMLAQRAYSAIAGIREGRPAGETVIEGRTVRTRQEWIMSFDLPGDRRKKAFVKDDGAWKKVRSANASGEAETWCIRVEEDESFTAEGCIVKNCPLQYDIVDRAIAQYTERGETVYDPFGGLMTVPFRAVKLGRKGIGVELNKGYWLDGVKYVEAAAREVTTPSLFDFLEGQAAEEKAAPAKKRRRSA
ncbi:hypothetical protein [Paracoccus sp. 22332]|uniref:hypothetical protein n=1 Tax=Paracoccus sp. 22332 TaxID=3453913 RepID=UPI003F85FCB8